MVSLKFGTHGGPDDWSGPTPASEPLLPTIADTDSPTRLPNQTKPPTATSSVASLEFSIPLLFLRFSSSEKNFGARPAYLFALAYPDRILGVITIGVPIMRPGPLKFDKKLSEGFYISRWQEPGRAEADFGRFDAKTVVRNIYILFSRSEIPIAAENQEIMDLVDPSNPLPPWFTKEDLAAYRALYEKSGFQTALLIPYRAHREEFGLTNLIVKVPALYIMGGKDYVNKFPGIDYHIDIGRVKSLSPIWRFNSCPKDRISFKNSRRTRLISLSLPSLKSTFDC